MVTPTTRSSTECSIDAALGDRTPVGVPPAINIRNLSKSYQSRSGVVDALRDITLSVHDGEFVSLIGPSGCGKTTILNILSGLLPYDGGEVIVGGEPARAGRHDVGLMPQNATLLPWLSVLKNVLLPLTIFHKKDESAVRRAHALLEITGLTEFEDKYPWELSGGMQQRANLVRALVFEPRFLLMDEPFAALDEFTREKLTIELAGLHERENRTTVYVTHNIAEAVFLSDHVVVMRPRPAEVVEIVETHLPRPRSRYLIDDPQTARLVTHIRETLFRYEIQ